MKRDYDPAMEKRDFGRIEKIYAILEDETTNKNRSIENNEKQY